MKKPITVHLGFEVGTGSPVSVPLAHTFVTGQTQASGKTTTLQAIVARSGCRALAFSTKRGEKLDGRLIRPYLPREGESEIHWRFVETIMASALGQRQLKYERLQIINATKGARSLEDVRANLARLLAKSKSGTPAAGIYELLGEYLDLVLPEMRALNASHELDLQPGLNVMDLIDASPEMQALAIGAAIGHINDHEHGVLTVFPEAWQFAPRDRNTAAKFQAEKMARMGAVIGNFELTDSQDIVGVSPVLRQAATVWIVGVQGEANELKRTLEVVKSKIGVAPRGREVATLGVGEFFVCHGRAAVKTYIQPAWMDEKTAREIAMGRLAMADVQPPKVIREMAAVIDKPAEVMRETRKSIPKAPVNIPAAIPLTNEDDMAKEDVDRLEKSIGELAGLVRTALKPGTVVTTASRDAGGNRSSAVDEDAMYERFKSRLIRDAERDPQLIAVIANRPEIKMEIRKVAVQADTTNLSGRLAFMVGDGWFNEPKKAHPTMKEMVRRGWSHDVRHVSRALDKLAEDGVLTVETDGYKKAPGVKITK